MTLQLIHYQALSVHVVSQMEISKLSNAMAPCAIVSTTTAHLSLVPKLTSVREDLIAKIQVDISDC